MGKTPPRWIAGKYCRGQESDVREAFKVDVFFK
jgi:hypothetical protein